MVATRTAKRRVSRHKKAYWRKGTDITDVDEHLEEERLLERTGGPIANKSNDELFIIEKVTTTEETSKPIDDKVKLLDSSTWSCFKSLQPNPLINPAAKSGPGISAASRKRLQKKYRLSVQEKPIPKVFEGTSASRNKVSDNVEVYDLWAPETKKTNLPDEVEDYTLRYVKKKMPNIPATKRTQITKLSAIEIAAPGASYNPSLPDYQILLERAAAIETQKEKAEERLDRQVAPVVHGEPVTEATRMKEMSEGILNDEDMEKDQEKKEEAEEAYTCAVAPTTSDKKKSKSQRLKERRRKLLAKAKQSEKEKKIIESDVFRLKNLKKQLRAREQKIAAGTEKRAKLKLETKLTTANRLSKFKFEAPEVEVQLPDELAGTLRQLKPEGSILEDRFKSLQKRNIIECRVRQRKKLKYQRKKFESKAHQAVTLDYKPR